MTRLAPTLTPVRSWDGPIEDHPICRGAFAGLVFSGSRALLGELPGEMTADTPFKFALIDPRLSDEADFARSRGMPLPMWGVRGLEPTDGVCFVLSDRAHPAVAALEARGAEGGRHFVIAAELWKTKREDLRDRRLAALLRGIDEKGRILILGYGDQGARIAQRLRSVFDVDAGRLLIVDHGPASAERAERDGLIVVAPEAVPVDVAAVIYSPLMRYEGLYRLFSEAQAAGRLCLDNCAAAAGDRRPQFTALGSVSLDESALSAIAVEDRMLRARPHGLPIEAFIVREDLRRLRDKTVRHLHAGQRTPLRTAGARIDLSQMRPDDDLDPSTFTEARHAWVSVRDTRATAVFAAREFCRSIWPEATERLFPAPNLSCLGESTFERLLARHVHRAEIAQASQTSAQQVVLGIAAARYAARHPIIELGSALGGSALLMAAATEPRGGAVYSIDPATADRDVMRFAFQREGLVNRLHQLVMTSEEAIGRLHDLTGRAGLVFIDALHTEPAALADFRVYAPLIRRGGALLVHDVMPARFSVFRVVLEHILPDERFEIRCMVDGLAVFERRP
jgi:predicted O-methyltransferase YrrM